MMLGRDGKATAEWDALVWCRRARFAGYRLCDGVQEFGGIDRLGERRVSTDGLREVEETCTGDRMMAGRVYKSRSTVMSSRPSTLGIWRSVIAISIACPPHSLRASAASVAKQVS